MLLDLPSNRDEDWRWSDPASIDAARRIERSAGVVETTATFLPLEGPRLIFSDGYYDEDWSEPAGFDLGFYDASSEHPLARHASGQGYEMRFAAGTSTTVQILHTSIGGDNHVPMRFLVAEGAEVTIVETFTGAGWSNRLTEIDLAPAAQMRRSVRLLQDEGFVSVRDEAVLAAHARLESVVLAGGGMGSRIDASIRLSGAGAFAEIGGALLGGGRQRHDASVVVRHEEPAGTSRQLWRSVADDRATCSVAARVEVARAAQKTDGEQSLRGLLLSRTATINAKPELEIFADDVKCAHGATVGELDREALFYMASRGVPEAEATALLTRAFVADAIERIGEAAVREAFEADVERWFSSPSPISGEGGARREAVGG